LGYSTRSARQRIAPWRSRRYTEQRWHPGASHGARATRRQGGRQNIEETVQRLQSLEKRGETVDLIFLIFDRDDKPTSLESTSKVKLLQWQRHCLENYLLDLDVITELLKKPEIAREPIKNTGQVEKLLREIAFSQIDEIGSR
jgi:hypothetical protein